MRISIHSGGLFVYLLLKNPFREGIKLQKAWADRRGKWGEGRTMRRDVFDVIEMENFYKKHVMWSPEYGVAFSIPPNFTVSWAIILIQIGTLFLRRRNARDEKPIYSRSYQRTKVCISDRTAALVV